MNPNLIEQENLSPEDEAVRRLVAELPRARAPKDFDFRLKARIANSKAEDFKPRFLPVFRYAAPLAFVLIISAVMVVNSFYSVDNQTIAPVAENPAPVQSENPADNSQTGETLAGLNNSAPENNETLTANTDSLVKKDSPNLPQENLIAESSKKNLKPAANKKDDEGAGSKLSSATNASRIFPPGLNPDKKIEKPDEFDKPGSFSVKGILANFGIEAVFSDKKWKVVKVRENSFAERSGVKQNDIIEAIDETRIENDKIMTRVLTIENLTVSRDGKKLEIKLQNK